MSSWWVSASSSSASTVHPITEAFNSSSSPQFLSSVDSGRFPNKRDRARQVCDCYEQNVRESLVDEIMELDRSLCKLEFAPQGGSTTGKGVCIDYELPTSKIDSQQQVHVQIRLPSEYPRTKPEVGYFIHSAASQTKRTFEELKLADLWRSGCTLQELIANISPELIANVSPKLALDQEQQRHCNFFRMMTASCSGTVEAVTQLLDEVDPNTTCVISEGELSPMLAACHYGHHEVVHIMLGKTGKHQGDPNKFCTYQRKNLTPLGIAIEDGHSRVIEELLQHKRTCTDAVSRCNNMSFTAFETAERSNKIEILIQLQASKLCKAITCGLLTKVVSALREGAEVNPRQNPTPLDLAVGNKQVPCARILLEAGASTKDLSHIFKTISDPKDCSFLLEYGASENPETLSFLGKRLNSDSLDTSNSVVALVRQDGSISSPLSKTKEKEKQPTEGLLESLRYPASSSLSVIILANAGVDSSGLNLLSSAIHAHTSLRALDLQGNSLNAEGASIIADILTTNTSLSYLNISRNTFPPHKFVSILCSLKCNNTLTALIANDIFPSELPVEIAQQVIGCLRENVTLRRLEFPGFAQNKTILQHNQEFLKFFLKYLCCCDEAIQATPCTCISHYTDVLLQNACDRHFSDLIHIISVIASHKRIFGKCPMLFPPKGTLLGDNTQGALINLLFPRHLPFPEWPKEPYEPLLSFVLSQLITERIIGVSGLPPLLRASVIKFLYSSHSFSIFERTGNFLARQYLKSHENWTLSNNCEIFVPVLYLSNMRLQNIPPEFCTLFHTFDLHLERNQLEHLPTCTFDIKTVHLGSNPITHTRIEWTSGLREEVFFSKAVVEWNQMKLITASTIPILGDLLNSMAQFGRKTMRIEATPPKISSDLLDSNIHEIPFQVGTTKWILSVFDISALVAMPRAKATLNSTHTTSEDVIHPALKVFSQMGSRYLLFFELYESDADSIDFIGKWLKNIKKYLTVPVVLVGYSPNSDCVEDKVGRILTGVNVHCGKHLYSSICSIIIVNSVKPMKLIEVDRRRGVFLRRGGIEIIFDAMFAEYYLPTISYMPSHGLTAFVPSSWLALRKSLQKRNLALMSWNDFSKFCQSEACGEGRIMPTEMRLCSEFFEKSGTIARFRPQICHIIEENYPDIVVVNPHSFLPTILRLVDLVSATRHYNKVPLILQADYEASGITPTQITLLKFLDLAEIWSTPETPIRLFVRFLLPPLNEPLRAPLERHYIQGRLITLEDTEGLFNQILSGIHFSDEFSVTTVWATGMLLERNNEQVLISLYEEKKQLFICAFLAQNLSGMANPFTQLLLFVEGILVRGTANITQQLFVPCPHCLCEYLSATKVLPVFAPEMNPTTLLPVHYWTIDTCVELASEGAKLQCLINETHQVDIETVAPDVFSLFVNYFPGEFMCPLSLIGNGAYGHVYKAYDIRKGHPHPMAVKKLKGNTVEAFLQFKLEVTLMKMAEHPNLIRLLGISGTKRTELQMIVEFIPPPSIPLANKLLGCLPCPDLSYLIEHLRDGIQLSTRTLHFCRMAYSYILPKKDLVSMLLDIATAMRHLHSRGIFHSDLHPGNVFVQSVCHAKVADFGLGQLLIKNHRHGHSYAPTYVPARYNPETNSPEAMNGGPCTLASDVYNFGLLCRYLLDPFTKPFDHLLSTPKYLILDSTTHIPVLNEIVLRKALQQGECSPSVPVPSSNSPMETCFTQPELQGAQPTTFSIPALGPFPVTPKWECEEWLVYMMESCWEPNPTARPTFDHVCETIATHWNAAYSGG
ncbi:hypothetical protein Pelo_7758 [Pelomyxa schiedti]|nr:hypothetical protein Pelo_7758 [Pelomyxa schiedti]